MESSDLDGPVVIHGVHDIFHPAVMLKEWPIEDISSRTVFIMRDIDESAHRDTLKMFETSGIRQPKILPVESGDGDVAVFKVPK